MSEIEIEEIQEVAVYVLMVIWITVNGVLFSGSLISGLAAADQSVCQLSAKNIEFVFPGRLIGCWLSMPIR